MIDAPARNMVFSSPVFLFLFLPLVLFFTLIFRERKIQNIVLLIASLLFYAWGETIYVLIMLSSIIMNYLFGMLIGTFQEERSRKAALVLGVVFNVALIGFFKYANFITDQLNIALTALSFPPIDLEPVHLPIGISFFTFQSISYIVDVHRRQVEPQRRPLDLALYISLFPQLIAGPIVRYKDVATQLLERTLSAELFASGVKRFVVGLAKKVIVANTAGSISKTIFEIPAADVPMDVAWLGVLCYSIQIYYDFSGYSDMAIGLGRMFGFRFLENFNFPYISRSIKEFWQRWHISLSSWFRDYLYIPLGGNRGSGLATYRNLFLVFFMTGLWHGASWNYIIWGMIHGFFILIEKAGLGKWLDQVWKPIGILYTMFIINVTWVFFCIGPWADELMYLKSMFGFNVGDTATYFTSFFMDLEIAIVLLVGAIFTAPMGPYLISFFKSRTWMNDTIWESAKYAGIVLLFLLSCLYLASSTYNPFIYFRF